MRPIRVEREDGTPLADMAFATEDVSERITGWFGRLELGSGEGLLIAPCGSVHTLGMHFDLDLVFLGADLRVLKVLHGVKPNRMAFAPWRMLVASWRSQALELPAGSARRAGLKAGEVLSIKERIP